MSEELKQEEYFVATLDILGYSHFVKTASKDKVDHLLTMLTATFDKTQLREFLNDRHNPTDFMTILQMPVSEIGATVFSDNILLYMKCSPHELGNVRNFLIFIEKVNQILLYFLDVCKLLVRGAITMGNFAYNEDFVFGEAIIDVHNLELKANYPRVVLDKTMVERFFNFSKQYEGLPIRFLLAIVKDGDEYILNHFEGFFYSANVNQKDIKIIDVFKHNLPSNPPDIQEGDEFIRIKRNIKEIIQRDGNYNLLNSSFQKVERKSVEAQHKVILKLLWLLDYYNICCKTILVLNKAVIHYQIINDPIHHLPKIVLLEDEQEEQP